MQQQQQPNIERYLMYGECIASHRSLWVDRLRLEVGSHRIIGVSVCVCVSSKLIPKHKFIIMNLFVSQQKYSIPYYPYTVRPFGH